MPDDNITREVILRIRTDWAPGRIAAVLIGDKKTNVSRVELIEATEAPPDFTSSRGDY